MCIKIRKAVPDDITAIQKVASFSWHETYSGLIPEAIQDKFLANAYSDEFMRKRVEQTILMVAEINEEIVGFANAFTKGNIAELSAIYLYKEMQGKGIGTKLLTALLHELKTFSEIYVEVEKGNLVGELFYAAKGFTVVKEYEDVIYGHPLQTKRLVLPL
ncbi:GNAT family N-acetyltransferase [Gracilibacillus caseinilyticus]|uniref:GNAT family N-acetyltransferase n=1 Tax=Gracilibacillus caseinilyticus TaxID=2932256 RepID=A0ABY4EX54_9BACI|nr:GNAT family N-acetyltransferase [Gracilibacillus caseinilyticus]UOQ48997.1 GNAT family N-acetyltransferase [Gracilibacillus caseinilyticus]